MSTDTDRINWLEEWLAANGDDFVYLQRMSDGIMLDTFHTASLTRPTAREVIDAAMERSAKDTKP